MRYFAVVLFILSCQEDTSVTDQKTVSLRPWRVEAHTSDLRRHALQPGRPELQRYMFPATISSHIRLARIYEPSYVGWMSSDLM